MLAELRSWVNLSEWRRRYPGSDAPELLDVWMAAWIGHDKPPVEVVAIARGRKYRVTFTFPDRDVRRQLKEQADAAMDEIHSLMQAGA